MSRGSSSEDAKEYRAQGHADALKFARLIGQEKDYQRDKSAKKDVVDPAGDTHSIKSGRIKWQIFLYRRSRLLADDGFQSLDGIGSLLVDCIDAFPENYDDYANDKTAAKLRLQIPMRQLSGRLQSRSLLRAFLRKSIFNGGEVNYLTLCEESQNYHVYYSDDIVEILAREFEVVNSRARPWNPDELDDQKVLFRYESKNVGWLEVRNDGRKSNHYREVLFDMRKQPCMRLLNDAKLPKVAWSGEIALYGKACNTFGKWD